MIISADKKDQSLLLIVQNIDRFEERERRKTGIEKCGVCLVIAWIGEVIQCGQWKIDPQFLSDEPGAKLQQGESHPPKNLIDFPSNQQPPSGI